MAAREGGPEMMQLPLSHHLPRGGASSAARRPSMQVLVPRAGPIAQEPGYGARLDAADDEGSRTVPRESPVNKDLPAGGTRLDGHRRATSSFSGLHMHPRRRLALLLRSRWRHGGLVVAWVRFPHPRSVGQQRTRWCSHKCISSTAEIPLTTGNFMMPLRTFSKVVLFRPALISQYINHRRANMFPSLRSATGSTPLDSLPPHRRSLPGLPSFDELTEGLWGYRRTDTTTEPDSRPPILPSPFASPAGSVCSPNFPSVLGHRPSQESRQPTPLPVALYPPPPPVRYGLPPTTATPPAAGVRQPSREDDRPTKLSDDLTKIPLGWSYKEALDAITQSSFALHEFGRRFAEEYQQLETPPGNHNNSNSETSTYARLPSRLMVIQMLGNVAIVQKKLKEVQGVVRRAEEGGYEPPSSGKAEGEEEGMGEGRHGSARAGRGRTKRRRRDGGEGGGGVTKKQAPLLHNKCRQLHVQDGKMIISGRCLACGCTESTEWRRGPEGTRTLCNACGLRYAKACAGRSETVTLVVTGGE
ncbi:hypothetical protein B0T18DRAFT_96634 [Schizothecium vesticola]|uniref:GATA-type domain-containing protein n=1 Tax=Schizothecium vesticola TaxID=314040 RepID=A0AA40F129_9PEZI|nr:hypothetical protein B0T18DRAFT_96634 [Schizothecium vesticola]